MWIRLWDPNSPTPDVTWERLDSRLPDRVQLLSGGQELVIPGAYIGDSGRYRCVANNSLDSQTIHRASADFYLTVESM